MKKLFLFSVFLFFSLVSIGQLQYLTPAYVPNETTAKLDVGVPINTVIYAGINHVPYICIKQIGGGIQTMQQAINGGYIIPSPYSVTFINLATKRDTTMFQYELVSDGQNNFIVPLTLKHSSTVFYNYSLLPTFRWSGKGTTLLHLNLTTKKADKLTVQW